MALEVMQSNMKQRKEESVMLKAKKILTASEVRERLKFRCKCGHNGLEHPRCYDRQNQKEEEHVGFFDIETEDLNADYGIMFCYCIKDAKSNKIYQDIINLDDIKKYSSRDRNEMPKEDTRVLRSMLSDMQNFDRLVGHYSSRFDLAFVRTRATMCGLDFPSFGEYYQTDTWMILKNKFKLSRNSLENAHLKLLGFTRKDKLSLSIKHGCLRGERWALDLTLEHCKKDVLDTEDLYNQICKFTKFQRSSI